MIEIWIIQIMIQLKLNSVKINLLPLSIITENHDFGDNELITNNTSMVTKEDQISFNTTKDLKDDFTSFINYLMHMLTFASII